MLSIPSLPITAQGLGFLSTISALNIFARDTRTLVLQQSAPLCNSEVTIDATADSGTPISYYNQCCVHAQLFSFSYLWSYHLQIIENRGFEASLLSSKQLHFLLTRFFVYDIVCEDNCFCGDGDGPELLQPFQLGVVKWFRNTTQMLFNPTHSDILWVAAQSHPFNCNPRNLRRVCINTTQPVGSQPLNPFTPSKTSCSEPSHNSDEDLSGVGIQVNLLT
jgi:hypothetical protein